VIGFVALIFLADMYSPEQFGELDTYMKMAGVIVAIAGLRYEIAIVVEDDEKSAQDITRLSLTLNAIVSFTVLLIILLFKNSIAELFRLNSPNLLYVVPVMVWLTSSTDTLVSWRNRAKDYTTISTNKIISSVTNVGYKLSHPFQSILSGNGLVLGTILGQAIAFIHITRKLAFNIFDTYKDALKLVWTKYKPFALFSTPSALVNILAINMPWFVIAAFDGQAATGHFGNAYKLTYLPMSMLGMALGQVFFERIARLKSNKDESAAISHQLFNLMFAAAVIPAVVLAVWGDEIAPWLLGEKWREAGIYIQITILFYFSMFLTSRFSSAFSTYNKLSIQLIYNIIFLVATFSALYFGYTIGGDTRTALAWFAIVGITLRIAVLNYFFVLFGKNLIAKTIFAIALTGLLIWLGFGIKEGF
jgi:O-antigen/teichoic acid export membrane protein